MSNLTIQTYVSYSQLCVFLSSLAQPFNDWSARNFSQGFSWRPGSASFRALVEDGPHQIHVLINEPVTSLPTNCIRAFRVPFDISDGNIEIASISDSTSFEIAPGKHVLQVEFLRHPASDLPEVNVRLNIGDSDFLILKHDSEIDATAEFDLMANAAT
jgi:hypothetical protein